MSRNLVGTLAIALMVAGCDGAGPNPPPDRLAFASQIGNDFGIYVSDADGSNPVALTAVGGNGEPAWSADGSTIAFSTGRDGNNEVYVMNADGSGPVNLSNNASSDNAPSRAPSGQRIAFHSFRDGDYEIYTMLSNGTDQVRLTNSPGMDFEPDWSPDGNRIVFASGRDGNGGSEIYVMDADGSSPVRLTTSVGDDSRPDWSPDGQRIAFQSNRDGNLEVYVMEADGSNQTRLTTTPSQQATLRWDARVVTRRDSHSVRESRPCQDQERRRYWRYRPACRGLGGSRSIVAAIDGLLQLAVRPYQLRSRSEAMRARLKSLLGTAWLRHALRDSGSALGQV